MGINYQDGLKVLGYGNLDKLKSTMNNHFYDQINLVSDEMTQTPKNLDELNEYVLDNKFTHVFIPDEHFHNLEGSFSGCKVPVVEFLKDHWIPWAVDRKRKYILDNGIKDIIVVSERFHDFYQDITNLHAVLPGFDSSVFFDKKLNRDIDVLIHGSLGEDTFKWVYPVRNWLAETLPEIGIKEGINVLSWKHPGYWNGEFEKGTIPYSNVINNSKIAIGGSSHWKLPLQKFYEVPACNTILLSDLPKGDKDFFKGKILEIDSRKIKCNGYEDTLRRKIMDTLDNYEKFKVKLQPFTSDELKFSKSLEGKALEIRNVLSKIK